MNNLANFLFVVLIFFTSHLLQAKEDINDLGNIKSLMLFGDFNHSFDLLKSNKALQVNCEYDSLMGLHYLKGLGTNKDLQQAEAHFLKASKCKDINSIKVLVQLYESKNAKSITDLLYVEFLNYLALSGDNIYKLNYSLLAFHKDDLSKLVDVELVEKYLKEIVQLNLVYSSYASYNLGLLYSGEYYPDYKNIKEAEFFFKFAEKMVIKNKNNGQLQWVSTLFALFDESNLEYHVKEVINCHCFYTAILSSL